MSARTESKFNIHVRTLSSQEVSTILETGLAAAESSSLGFPVPLPHNSLRYDIRNLIDNIFFRNVDMCSPA